jgi:hypothetical protein
VVAELPLVAVRAERDDLVVDVEAERPAALAARVATPALGADERVAAHSFSQAIPSLSRSSPRL